MTDTIDPVTSAGTDNTGNGARAPRCTRSWSIQGQRIGSEEWEVVAEGLTRKGTVRFVETSSSLLRRLYSKLRPVKVMIGGELEL